MKHVVLPETFLRCMSAEDRKLVGAGMTAEEFMAKGAAANERNLQKQIIGYLRLKGIEPIVSAMHRKTTNNVGTPDILFAVQTCDGVEFTTYAAAWEVKMPGKHLQPEQERMGVRLISPPNHWRHCVIHSVEEAKAELAAMGVE